METLTQPLNGSPTHASLAEMRPDPAQPRKSFPAAEQAALRESIQANGIQEALIVRQDPEYPKGKWKWMLVEGERRWRVAGELGLERVPISVREFKDEAAVRAFQRIVGTQRLNLSALEQAADLDRELKARQASNAKFSVRDLAEDLGLAPATTYESLKLLKISAPVRAALESGRLDASKARLFATVPAAEHSKLLKWATEERYDSPPVSVRQLVKHIEEDYSRQLNGAPWKHADAELLKSAGPCSTCPKRSGNIEGMEGNPNICTDVECYEKKQTAHAIRTLQEAKAQNKRVIPSEEYQRKRYSGFEKADEKCYDDPKRRSFAQLAKMANIDPAVTVDEKGHALEVFTTADVAAIKKAVGIKVQKYSHGPTPAEKAKRAAEAIAIREAVIAASQKATAEHPKLPLPFWQRLARTVIGTHPYGLEKWHWEGRSLAYTGNSDKDIDTLLNYVKSDRASVLNLISLIVQVELGSQVTAHCPEAFAIWGVDWKDFLPDNKTEKPSHAKSAKAAKKQQQKSPLRPSRPLREPKKGKRK